MVGGRGEDEDAALRINEEPVQGYLNGLVDPGSYLLSRDLSSDYHRRADVSLPGSEWDRVGPSGYDHQVAIAGVVRGRVPVGLCCAFTFCLLLCGGQADIRVAVVG